MHSSRQNLSFLLSPWRNYQIVNSFKLNSWLCFLGTVFFGSVNCNLQMHMLTGFLLGILVRGYFFFSLPKAKTKTANISYYFLWGRERISSITFVSLSIRSLLYAVVCDPISFLFGPWALSPLPKHDLLRMKF